MKHFIKRSCFIVAMLLMIPAISVASEYQLYITDNNDNSYKFSITNGLTVHYINENLVIHTSDDRIGLQFGEIKKYTYDNHVSEVEEIAPAVGNLEISKDTLRYSAPESTEQHFHVYDTLGKLKYAQTFKSSLLFDLHSLSSGLYIIKIESLPAFKLLLK